jgi:hypothetical protein
MNQLQKIMLVVLCTILIATALPSGAYAGVNGQQIKAKFSGADCVTQWTVTVKGYNQSGVYTVWKQTKYPSFFYCEIPTTNSWWKGSVSISATRTTLGGTFSKTVNVPKTQLSNWVVVKLP